MHMTEQEVPRVTPTNNEGAFVTAIEEFSTHLPLAYEMRSRQLSVLLSPFPSLLPPNNSPELIPTGERNDGLRRRYDYVAQREQSQKSKEVWELWCYRKFEEVQVFG